MTTVVINRMEENLRNSIYWQGLYTKLNERGHAAFVELFDTMLSEHGSAAQRLLVEIYQKHGLIGPKPPQYDGDQCNATPRDDR